MVRRKQNKTRTAEKKRSTSTEIKEKRRRKPTYAIPILAKPPHPGEARASVRRVALALETLRLRKIPPTVFHVQMCVGGGSRREIINHLRWLGITYVRPAPVTDSQVVIPDEILTRVERAVENVQADGHYPSIERVRARAELAQNVVINALRQLRGRLAPPPVSHPPRRRTTSSKEVIYVPVDESEEENFEASRGTNGVEGEDASRQWVSAQVDTRVTADPEESPQVAGVTVCTAMNNPGQDSVCDPEDSPLRSARHPGGDPAARHSGSNQRRPGKSP